MEQIVEITEAASFQVKEMMRHNAEEDSYLRVAVKGGGCSGLTYGMGFEKEQGTEDDLYEQFGIPILIAKDDAPILKGTVVDYKQSLMG